MSLPSDADQRAYARNLRVYYVFAFFGQALLLLPIWVAYLLLERGLSLTEVALIEAPFWLAILLAEVPTGAVADRWGRRVSLVLGAGTTALAIAAFGLADTLPLILVSYVIWGIAMTLTSGADNALLYDTLRQLGREREFERYAGRGMALRSAGIVLAMLAGGPVAEATSLQTTVFLSAAVTGLLGLTALFFREPPHREAGGAQVSYWAGLRTALGTVRRTPAVGTAILLGAMLLAGATVPVVLAQPFLLSHGYDVGWEFSLLQAPISLAAVGGGLLVFRLLGRAGSVGTLGTLGMVLVGSYVGAALWDSVGAVAFLATMSLVRAVGEPVLHGYINHRVPSAQRATVLSLSSMASSLVLAPIMPLLGFSADEIDLPAAFGVGAGVLGVAVLVSGVLWTRAHRAHPLATNVAAVPAEQVPPLPRPLGASLESGVPLVEE